jgi:site-specific recombinase XerD
VNHPAAPALAPLLRSFFVDRLLRQRNASPATIASYRDTFRLLLRFAEAHLHRPAASLTIEDLSAPLVLAFLDHLERERGNTVRTRNARLAAVHSFASHAGREEPATLEGLRRVLAIPAKRFSRPVMGYLSREEIQAILDAPDRGTWSGHRDAVLLATLYNTGARISEALALDVQSVHLDRTPRVDLRGKGRKERTVPLWRTTARSLAKWIAERNAQAQPSAPLFPNRHGDRLTRSGVARRLALAVGRAAKVCTSLRGRDISPHTLRHTTAMHLLESGTDISVIALWLGHESPTTTHAYLQADLAMKERALARVDVPRGRTGKRFRASDALLAFLDQL